jgi:hypothetical protein
VLLGSIGLAALAGTLVMVRWRVTRPVYVALLALVAQAISLIMVGFAPLPAVLAATVTIGLTAGLASPLLAGVLQATVDHAYVARVGSVTNLADSTLIPISLAGFGILAGATSVTLACATCGVGFLLQLAYALSRRQIRTLHTHGTIGPQRSADRAISS